MKKTFRLLAITIIIAMLMPAVIANAATTRTEKIVESLKESAKSYDGKVTYESNCIEISWNIRDSKINTVDFSYDGNIIEYNSGKLTTYEQANDAMAHYMYAIYLIRSALRVNGYTDEQIQTSLQKEPSFDVNGIEFKETGEAQKFTSKDGSVTTTVSPMHIKIDVTKANVNTASDAPVMPKPTTINDIVKDLQNDSDFTTLKDDEGNIYSEHEISNEDNTITISNTSYIDNYHNVSLDCENDILTYEDETMHDYYDAERALSHQMYAAQILMLALKENGYTAEQYQEFVSSNDNGFDYDLNGIEFRETGEAQKFTSDDESSTVTITPMSIKIDLAKANLKKVNEEEVKQKEYTISSNTNSGDSISFTAPEGTIYSFSIIDRLSTTDEDLKKVVELFNDPEYTFEALKEQLNKIIAYGKKAAGDTGTLLKIYEAYLTNNGDDVHEADGGFKIKLKMTDDMKGYDSYKLVYIADDGTTEKAIELTKNGEYLEGKLPHLSMYALVGNKTETPATDASTAEKEDTTKEETPATDTNKIVKDTTTAETSKTKANVEAKTNNPKTGDNIIIVFSIFAISLLGVFITIIVNRKINARKH